MPGEPEEPQEPRQNHATFTNNARRLYRTATSTKGHVTRKCTQVYNATKALQDCPSKTAIEILKEDLNKLDQQLTRYEDAMAAVIEADEVWEEELEAEREKEVARINSLDEYNRKVAEMEENV